MTNTFFTRTGFLVRCLLFLGLGLGEHPDAGAQNSRPLSLEEAIRLGMDNSKQLKVSASKVDIARAKVKQYFSAQLPIVNLNAGYSRLSDNIDPFIISIQGHETVLNPQILNQFSNRLSLQQVLFAGFRSINTYRSTEIQEKMSELDHSKEELEVKNNIINAYYNLYKGLQTRQVLQENIKLLQARVADARNFATQGLLLDNDVMKIELALSNVELSLADINNAVDNTQFNLNLLLGLPEDTQIEPNTVTDAATVSVLPFDNYERMALDGRQELQSANLRKSIAEKGVTISKGTYYPVISLGANYYYSQPNQRIFPPEEKFKGTWDAGLNLSYNLTNLYTTQYQVQEAQANVVQAAAAADQTTNAIRMDVHTQYGGYQVALQRIEIARKALGQASENQRVLKNRFEHQLSSVTDLLDADYASLQAQINLTTANADAILAYYRLLKAVGK